jgi:hypothetical protein
MIRKIKVHDLRTLLEYFKGRPDLDKDVILSAIQKLFARLPEGKVLCKWDDQRDQPCCPPWPYLCDPNCQRESDLNPFGTID